MQTHVGLLCLCLASLVALSAQLPSSAPSCGLGLRRNPFSPPALHQRSTANSHAPLRIRGGADSEEEPAKKEAEGNVSLLDELKNNLSWNPADHPSAFHWALCVILNLYVAFGAPFANYIPIVRDLALSRKPKKETKLTKADLARLEREAIIKEQNEEYEKSLLEDKVKSQQEKKKRELEEAAEKAEQEEAAAVSSVVDGYKARVDEARKRLTAEPAAGEGVVTMRLRCPDGLQLTRRFNTADKVGTVYDFIDVERYAKAQKAKDPNGAMVELGSETFSLVSTRPKLTLDDRTATIASAGVTTSCALMVKPEVKAE